VTEADFNFFMDWDNDGDFDEADENVTSFVKKASWDVGMKEAFQDTADESRAVMTFNNSDKRFSPAEYFTRIREQYAPIAHWRLNETSGTIADDNSGNGFIGNLIGSITTNQPGMGDGFTSFNFDDDTSVIDIYNEAFIDDTFDPTEFSIIFWAQRDDWNPGVTKRVIRFRVDGSNQIQINISSVSATMQYFYTAGGTSKQVDHSSISGTDWKMFSMTVSTTADEMKAFFNDSQTGSTQTGLGVFTTDPFLSTSVIIGSLDTTPATTQSWGDDLAHVMVFNRPLTETEIADIFSLHATRSARVLGRKARIESVLNGALQNYAEQAAEELKTDDEKSANLTDLLADSHLQEQDSGGSYLTE